MRRETFVWYRFAANQVFQSTPFVRRETSQVSVFRTADAFQSTPFVRRETPALFRGWKAKRYFNPLPSWEGRPAVGLMELWVDHFNPLPSWEGRHHSVNTSLNLSCISIHSLREKGDRSYPIIIPAVSYFNPLPSWEGRRGNIPVVFAFELFQSTPFVRRETLHAYHMRINCIIISIHSLREKGDLGQYTTIAVVRYFNPLPSWEGRPSSS